MWELTSIRGLNTAVRGTETCTFWSEDMRTGEACRDYGFDVGQPLPSPPIHPQHKNIGLGQVRRILAFPSLHELSFAFRFGGGDFAVELDGRRDLRVRLHAEAGARAHVRHVLQRGHDEIELRPGYSYEVVPGDIRVSPHDGPAPAADLSPGEALRQCVYGNTVRDPRGALYIPVNRAWVTMFGRMFGLGPEFQGPVTFIWDAAFASILAAGVDADLALRNLRLLIEQIEPTGCFRQLRVGDLMNNLTGLPVVSLAVRTLFERTGAVDLVAELYEPLLRANRWLRRHRDQNGDGLLEWGYEASGKGIEVPGRYAPGYESGLDDSPMWEDEPVDEERRCFASSAVCLNALAAVDCLELESMARLLRRDSEADELHAAYEQTRRSVNAELWDDDSRPLQEPAVERRLLARGLTDEPVPAPRRDSRRRARPPPRGAPVRQADVRWRAAAPVDRALLAPLHGERRLLAGANLAAAQLPRPAWRPALRRGGCRSPRRRLAAPLHGRVARARPHPRELLRGHRPG